METGPVPDYVRTLSGALNCIEAAIAQLDCADAPSQIAAHLDLAGHQLRDTISKARLCESKDDAEVIQPWD